MKTRRVSNKQFCKWLLKSGRKMVKDPKFQADVIRDIRPENGWIDKCDGLQSIENFNDLFGDMFPKLDVTKTERNSVLDCLKHGYFV